MVTISSAGHLTDQLEHVSLHHFADPVDSSHLDEPVEAGDLSSSLTSDLCGVDEENDCILSQDFFCTPDYITPEGQQTLTFDCNKENILCPRSPEKTVGSKRHRHEGSAINFLSSTLMSHEQVLELSPDLFSYCEISAEKPFTEELPKKKNCIPHSVVALRSRVMPPPCIKNPYLSEMWGEDLDVFANRRSCRAGYSASGASGEGFSRYRTDFYEIEQIGFGNFSHVFKVLKRIDGCLYAVKHSIKQLCQDAERRRALMEVQALAALGPHENIVGYYTSWFENDQLFIQMELCDHTLSLNHCSPLPAERILTVMYQIAKALHFIHTRGIAHLDVKPDNIYARNGVYKLGDFGCATLLDKSLQVEEGDARYMPPEILNDKYDHLDKADIFSLGAATYELLNGSPLPEAGPQYRSLREGKIILLPGYSMQFENLLKAMLDPDPVKRPSAVELLQHPVFEMFQSTAGNKATSLVSSEQISAAWC